jgi:serine/threonine protein kinase
MKQICEAMEYLHSHKVIHLDMKVLIEVLPFKFNEILNTFSQKTCCACRKVETELKLSILDLQDDTTQAKNCK